MTTPSQPHPDRTCPTCGGSGQISFFAGESRFLLTTEECPACFGTGLVMDTKPEPGEEESAADT